MGWVAHEILRVAFLLYSMSLPFSFRPLVPAASRFLGVRSLFVAALALAAGCTLQKSSPQTYAPAPAGRQIPKPDKGVIAPQGGPYQPERTRVFDLVHTKLELEPIWEKRQMKGLATVTITPHFGTKQELVLDAKGMEIRSVKKVAGRSAKALAHTYDGKQITIKLDSAYAAGRNVVLEIDYTAKPDEVAQGVTSGPISGDKGLYFINPMGTLPNRPKELWTQGETESSSHWFPTIDAPNQKSTEEIVVTVDTSMTTLSNGLLTSQVKLAGGKRQDTWEMKLPHAPYLFMLAVGPFAVIKESWRGKEVSYYVEKPFRNKAKAVFGHTPEMIEFFSNRLGVPYAWPKYSQIVARDYVSGAMENTSATLHMEELMVDEQQLQERDWDLIIAHELFHHWFGDLATSESWSNLSLNESFANYSEFLWLEHKKGADEADYHALEEKLQYLYESRFKREPLIRYRYNNEMQMFDSHSYAKGGRILHMLRNYLGDDAFFASLQHYLKKFSFKKAEAHDLRLAFEETTGQDLNWFFDQWYFKPGHPELNVRKTFTGESVILSIAQIQDTTYTPIYRLPFAVDVWHGDQKERYNLTLEGRDGTFELPMVKAPTLVQFDPDHILLAEIRYEKPREEVLQQFNFAPRALDRSDALELLVKGVEALEENVYLRKGLKDQNHFVREQAMELCNNNPDIDEQTRQMIAEMAKSDKSIQVRSDAAGLIGNQKIEPVIPRLTEILDRDKAYSVQAEALNQYVINKGPDVEARIQKLEGSPSPTVVRVVSELYATRALPDNLGWFKSRLHDFDKDNQYLVIKALGTYAGKTTGDTRAQATAMLDGLTQYQADSPNIRAALAAAVKNMDDKDPGTQALKAKLLKK